VNRRRAIEGVKKEEEEEKKKKKKEKAGPGSSGEDARGEHKIVGSRTKRTKNRRYPRDGLGRKR
jgi:hypothetical protein